MTGGGRKEGVGVLLLGISRPRIQHLSLSNLLKSEDSSFLPVFPLLTHYLAHNTGSWNICWTTRSWINHSSIPPPHLTVPLEFNRHSTEGFNLSYFCKGSLRESISHGSWSILLGPLNSRPSPFPPSHLLMTQEVRLEGLKLGCSHRPFSSLGAQHLAHRGSGARHRLIE